MMLLMNSNLKFIHTDYYSSSFLLGESYFLSVHSTALQSYC